MVKRSQAFSLVELIVTMMIITIASAAILPVISKAKPNIDVQTLRGQYACWWGEDGKLYEQYYDERKPRTAPIDISATGRSFCTMRFSQRPANFYIVSIGAGGKYDGKLETLYTPVVEQTLNMIPGKNTARGNGIGFGSVVENLLLANGRTHRDSIILNEDTTEFLVANGSPANLVETSPFNISKCYLQRLINPANGAEDVCVPEYTGNITDMNSVGDKIVRCEIVRDRTGADKIRIAGCGDGDTSYGGVGDINLRDFGTRQNGIDGINIDFNDIKVDNANLVYGVSLSDMQIISAHNDITYNQAPAVGQFANFGFSFIDDYYVPPEILFALNNNVENYNYNSIQHRSPMVDILEMISERRETPLVQKGGVLASLEPGRASTRFTPARNGAILVIW